MRTFKNKLRQEKLNNFYKSKNHDYYDFMNIPPDMICSTYAVQKGESLEYIAKLLRCSSDDIMQWNKLPFASVFNGQELIVYFPKVKTENQNLKTEVSLKFEKEGERIEKKASNFLYHFIKKGENLGQISTYYPDVTLSEIIKLNNLSGSVKLISGDKIKIKSL